MGYTYAYYTCTYICVLCVFMYEICIYMYLLLHDSSSDIYNQGDMTIFFIVYCVNYK